MKREIVALHSLHDGLRLYATITIPDIEPKGIVHIIHGLMECRDLYTELSTILASYGYVVMAVDQRGHGQSTDEEHPLGYFADQNGWIINLKDNNRFAKYIRERYRHLPYFMLGHGVGSLIARAYVKRYEYELDGLLLSNSLPYTMSVQVTKALLDKTVNDKNRKDPANKLLQSFYSNNCRKLKEKDTNAWLSSDIEALDLYREHPFCGNTITKGLLQDVVFGYQDVYVNQDWHPLKKQIPILFLAGKEDVCIDFPKGIDQAIKHFQQIGYENVECYSYENRRHLLFLGLDKEFVYSDMLMWLNQKSQHVK